MSGRIRIVVDGGLLMTSWRSLRAWMVDSRIWGGVQLSSAQASAPAALIALTSGLIAGFVRYLCLKKAALEMRFTRMVTDQNFQH
jgi:hypothetical protein